MPGLAPLPPRATYRVQVQPAFGLHATAELTSYLSTLGVSHVYSAPLLQAAPGSIHGYDVADPTRVSAELGGEDGRKALVAALDAHRMGLVVDIVPNHVGVAAPAANPAWWSVLRDGPQSEYARWFDVDWSRGPVLLPVLGDDSHVDRLRVVDGELRYYDHRFPLAPGTAPGGGESPREVHERQHYRLVGWRRGDAELTYRRFFAIADLAGVRVEDPDVFAATHGELLRWYAHGELDGLRVDHPDGLRDPGGYFDRLHAAAPEAWLVVEKITEPGEQLPDWPIAGLTGYDALGEVCGLFVDPAGEPALTALDRELTGVATDFPALARACKRDVATGMLRAELRRLARLVGEPADDVEDPVEAALAELLAAFPVYRSYLPFGREYLDRAVGAVRRDRPDLAPTVDALLPRLGDPADELAIRFQQVSGAVMAKGVEDTAFYRYTRFVALNEVGGDPTRFGVDPEAFHAAAGDRQRRHPTGMTTLSTHDTKRSEDVRARLAVLSELPDEWAATVRRWFARAPVPDGATAHLLWQTVAGAWPIGRERLHAAMEKSAREARTVTTWNDPDEAFETALHAAVDRVFDDPELHADVTAVARRLAPYGWSNALGQKLVQLTMPGVPDTYQGTELWDRSLVDPDNRRPVDYATRRDLLRRIDDGWMPPVDAAGAAKLLVTARTLRLRRDRPGLFTGYAPLSAEGPAAAHAVAFDRGGAVTVATRLPVGLERRGGWEVTTLALPGRASGGWRDVLTGERWPDRVELAALLGRYPVALLVGD